MHLPHSAIVIMTVLASRGPMTHKDLMEMVPLPERTIRYGLARLKEAEKLIERPSLKDARQIFYELKPADPPPQ